MARTVHEIDHGGNAPLIGALLRRPFLAARAHIIEQLHAAGHTDLASAHLAVFQHPGPDGRSPNDIAKAANASKQAINNLLAQLERTGYLTRQVNPANRRERTIELTERGRDAIATIRAAVDDLEKRWRKRLGAAEYSQLRRLLEKLNEVAD